MRTQRSTILTGLVLSSLLLSGGVARAASYDVDTDHTTVSFKIKHLFSYVQGTFKKFQGTVEYEPGKPETWSAQGTIDVASIDTNVPERDKHLKSADFFDAANNPTIEFKTTKITSVDAEHAVAEGTIKIHGVEKPVKLDVEIHGVGKDPWGNVRAGFTVTGTLNRKDFGLTWNKALETGQLLVGDEVKLSLELEAILKQ
ncbi:MAG TPA: YceI family protein [Candidatus Eisenbacteria bacterium]|jgi:polyisoprenoid-binding protein YceI|nr:YceI family protein [Candidatus Eisenbacteria bacterium]